MKIYKHVPELLKRLRKEKNITQGEMAEWLGYTSPQFISNVERGLCSLPLKKGKKASKLLGVDPMIFADAYLADFKINAEEIFKGWSEK